MAWGRVRVRRWLSHSAQTTSRAGQVVSLHQGALPASSGAPADPGCVARAHHMIRAPSHGPSSSTGRGALRTGCIVGRGTLVAVRPRPPSATALSLLKRAGAERVADGMVAVCRRTPRMSRSHDFPRPSIARRRYVQQSMRLLRRSVSVEVGTGNYVDAAGMGLPRTGSDGPSASAGRCQSGTAGLAYWQCADTPNDLVDLSAAPVARFEYRRRWPFPHRGEHRLHLLSRSHLNGSRDFSTGLPETSSAAGRRQ
jgi:hypothetical protein